MIEVKEPKRIPLIGSLQGMYTVFKHLFKKPITVQYPEEKAYTPARFKFRIFLSMDDCVGCTLCEQVCPNLSIRMIVVERNNPHNKRNLYPQVNFGTCTVCRNCEEICPTEAIYLTHELETARTKNNFFYSPEELEKTESEVKK